MVEATDVLMFLIITHHTWSELALITLKITTSTCQPPKLDRFHRGSAEPVPTPVWLLCWCDSSEVSEHVEVTCDINTVMLLAP